MRCGYAHVSACGKGESDVGMVDGVVQWKKKRMRRLKRKRRKMRQRSK